MKDVQKFLVGLISLLGVCLCTSQAKADLIPNPPGMPEISIETDKDVYEWGQVVNVVHRITNPYETDLKMELSSQPGFDLWVLRGSDKIWSEHNFRFPVFGALTLSPGESIEYHYTWDITDYEGNLVSPGEYELVGVIYGGQPDVSTQIAIVPEPGSLALMLLGFGFVSARKRRRLDF